MAVHHDRRIPGYIVLIRAHSESIGRIREVERAFPNAMSRCCRSLGRRPAIRRLCASPACRCPMLSASEWREKFAGDTPAP